jgi:2-hydroxychromene-2-carboxylate isomerase
VLPDSFPVNTVRSLRGVLYAKGVNAPSAAEKYVEDVFHAHWALGLDISNEQILAEIGRKYFDEKMFLEYVQSQEAKDLLRKETDKALERGVFGAPTFFIDGEMYWGTPEILWYLEQRMAKKTLISEHV